MLSKPEVHKLTFGKKEVIVQVGRVFYKLKPFKETDVIDFGKDLDKLNEKYHVMIAREAND